MRETLSGFGLGLVIVALPIVLLFATGSTFGQRCARAFPRDGLAQERCVYDLDHGVRP